MDDIFNILTSSTRIDKSKRKKRKRQLQEEEDDDLRDEEEDKLQEEEKEKSRDKTGKRDTSMAKQLQVKKEQMAAFRRSMKIVVKSSSETDVVDAISQFDELMAENPKWWTTSSNDYTSTMRSILANIEAGDWKEPTPIQMQAIPSILLDRKDVMASAPTGSGKSGAFILPALVLSSAPDHVYYGSGSSAATDSSPSEGSAQKKKKSSSTASSRQGKIRSLLLAPSRELAVQLHREVERLGRGKPGGLKSLLLTRSNASSLPSVGGKKGLDVLVTTPLRLVDVLEKAGESNKGLLDSVRLVVLDEADRLLDASDNDQSSGSVHTKTFISQLDSILSSVPATATRALFSATMTPAVHELSDSILRKPLSITIRPKGANGSGGANPDIRQELLFCGREEGKLLALRQMAAKGELVPPTLIFCQSKERAQALFSELLYDNLHVDVLHAGRSPAARDKAVQDFRTGQTWILICTDVMSRGVDFLNVALVINYDLPTSGVTYVHRVGRTGRAGRSGRAITFFTEADLDQLRAIANIIRQSGCPVQEWMLKLKKTKPQKLAKRRPTIDTTPMYDKIKRHKKKQMIQHSKKSKK